VAGGSDTTATQHQHSLPEQAASSGARGEEERFGESLFSEFNDDDLDLRFGGDTSFSLDESTCRRKAEAITRKYLGNGVDLDQSSADGGDRDHHPEPDWSNQFILDASRINSLPKLV
jgi:hypothetical protein